MEMQRITGLVLHFRTPEKTLTCLYSMQLEGINTAILVDNSQDQGKSIAEMKPALNQLSNSGFITIVQSTGKNLGFAAGVTFGLNYISENLPSHVLLINSDASLQAGTLDKMKINLNTGLLIAPYIAQNESPPTSPFFFYDRLFGLITTSPKIYPIHYASGCCLLIHKNLIKTPLFDQSFFFYGEDIMLGFKILQNKIQIHECPDAYITHATSTSSKNGSLFYEYHINRSHWLLAKKLAKNHVELVIFIIARCFTLPLRALVRSIRTRNLTALYGFFLAIFDLFFKKHRDLTPPPK